MKKIIFAYMLLLGSYIGHSQCLINGNFDVTTCGNTQNISGDCLYFGNTCVQNWVRSHGTPFIQINPAAPLTNYVYMWCLNDVGEGIVANYNFTANVPYLVSYRFKLDQANPPNASFNIRATNNFQVPPGASSGCGEDVPNLPLAQNPFILADNNHTNFDWIENSVPFTPTANYNRVWVYPRTTLTNQCNLIVDYIFICPDTCGGTRNYNSGVVPSGVSKFAIINAGSTSGTGGSGVVTVSSTLSTTLNAVNEINLVPNFDAVVTSGDFTAQIVPCSTGTQSRMISTNTPEINIPEKLYTIDASPIKENLNQKYFKIYPNPVTDLAYISSKDFISGEISIKICDNNGKINIVFSRTLTQKKAIPIDTRSLPDGIYFVTVSTNEYSETFKLIVQH